MNSAGTNVAISLPAFERLFRGDHHEEHAALYAADGHFILERRGDIDSVSFSDAELNRACYGTLTHIHPKALPPSGADLATAAPYALTLRAVGVDEDGRQWDYTVEFPRPDPALAKHIQKDFEDEQERAEQELARAPLTDRAWEREARHLALTRLAYRYGFRYERVWRNAPVGEMARHEVKRLNALQGAEKDIRIQWLEPLSDSLVRTLQRHTDEKGNIPAHRLDMLRRETSAIVQRSFLGTPDANGALAPYVVQHGQVMPRSAYFKTLWALMIKSASAAVERHAEIMRKHLPEGLRRQFEMATISPFEEVSEIGDFNPLHLFIGPDGKSLLDRIWSAAGDMLSRLDRFLTTAVLREMPGATIAGELLKFLLPGKGSALGGNGSFSAMRLARTENAAAYFRADSMAAQLDPMVETYSPYTAPEHACCDECDDIAAAGPYPKDDMTHLPPYHPHCICGVIWNLVQDIPGVIERLHKAIQNAISNARRSVADVIGPLSKRFLALLFGGKP